jgi:hypothetical protein
MVHFTQTLLEEAGEAVVTLVTPANAGGDFFI